MGALDNIDAVVDAIARAGEVPEGALARDVQEFSRLAPLELGTRRKWDPCASASFRRLLNGKSYSSWHSPQEEVEMRGAEVE